MSNSSHYTHNVNILSDQFKMLKQCYNNQEGIKLLLSQDNNSKSSSCSDRKIYVGDIALLDESPVNITQICSNSFKPASNEDEIAIDGQKTRKPRTVVNEKWSTEEDSRLAKAVKEHGAKNWKNIAKIVGGSRTDVQCLHRWRKVISPELVKGPWTSSEDKIIIEEVQKVNSLANVKWSEIAQRLHGRIGKQCRERYLNYLDASIKRTEWTEEEDRILFEIQRVIGNRWCEIAKVLPGRSENNVKNRYNSKIRNVYMTKYPNQMIPSSIIIEQQIEDPLHNSKKRRILCPAVKNLLKYLDLSKEYFENLNNFTNMKNGKDGNSNNSLNTNFSLSIQQSSSSSSSSSPSPSLILPINSTNDIQIKQEQLLDQPLKRSFKEMENDSNTPVDNNNCDDENKCKKPKLDSIINNELYNNNNLDYTLNTQFRYNEDEENDKTNTNIPIPQQQPQQQQHNQYQLRRKRRGYKDKVENIEEQQQQKRKREKLSIVNNNDNNINISPNTNYTDDSMLLSGIVDEEEAYKNFVETIPDNKLRNFNSNTSNINNNNNNNTNSLVKYNNCISNNFSDCSIVEDELNSSCLDCFQ